MTINFHPSNFKPLNNWKSEKSDKKGYEKFKQTMPNSLHTKLSLKVITLSIITFGIYYLYLKNTKNGITFLNNLKERAITHYIRLPKEGNETQKVAKKTQEKAQKVPSLKTKPPQVAKYEATFNRTKVVVTVADITKENVDAIVNAANEVMLGGGGVDAAIHKAAGNKLLEACEQYPADEQGHRCKVGEAKITEAGNLPAKHVIHAVGPKGSTPNRAQLLYGAHYNSLQLAADNQLESVTFPGISIGIFGYPIGEASQEAMKAVREFAENNTQIKEVRFAILIPGSENDVQKKNLENTILKTYGEALLIEETKDIAAQFLKKSLKHVLLQKFSEQLVANKIKENAAVFLKDLFLQELEKFSDSELGEHAVKLDVKGTFLQKLFTIIKSYNDDPKSLDPKSLNFVEAFVKEINVEVLNKTIDAALFSKEKKRVAFSSKVNVQGVEGFPEGIKLDVDFGERERKPPRKHDMKVMTEKKSVQETIEEMGLKFEPYPENPNQGFINQASAIFARDLSNVNPPIRKDIRDNLFEIFRTLLENTLEEIPSNEKDNLIDSIKKSFFVKAQESCQPNDDDDVYESELKKTMQLDLKGFKNQIDIAIENGINLLY